LLENYDVSQICDEMTIYLKHKMISKDAKFDLLLFDRFFRILSDAKHLLSINSDGGFVLILTLLKMIEATNIKTIDEIISQVEDIKPAIKQEPTLVKSNISESIIENIPETKIEEVTQEDKILIETTSMVDLSVIDSISEVSHPTPFDDLPTSRNQNISNSSIEIKEDQREINLSKEVEVIPIEEPQLEEKNEMYEQLIAKVYDRDYTLGECFENNFIFNGYEENKLSIVSYAQGDDRKFLYKHFALIRTFAQDVYGNDVELDFKKDEASTNISKTLVETQKKETKESSKEVESNIEDTGSMIEEIEMSSGCVADMHKSSTPKPSQQELQLNDIINSPMLNKAKELFDIKKITVKSRS